MRILLYSENYNRWIEPLNKRMDGVGIEWKWVSRQTPISEILDDVKTADVVVSMWADEAAIMMSKNIVNKPFYVYIRAYECYGDFLFKIDWSKVTGIFFCAKHIQDIANLRNPALRKLPQYFVPNWLDIDEFPLVKHENHKKLVLSCAVSWKKNIPMALQIMAKLPEEYSLHHVGWTLNRDLEYYLQHITQELNLDGRVFWYGGLQEQSMAEFYGDKDYVLSTSVREACPMNILEGMACGLQPIIHNWIGATEVFPTEYVFDTINEVEPMMNKKYEPEEFRNFVGEHHGLNHADKFINIITGGEK